MEKPVKRVSLIEIVKKYTFRNCIRNLILVRDIIDLFDLIYLIRFWCFIFLSWRRDRLLVCDRSTTILDEWERSSGILQAVQSTPTQRGCRERPEKSPAGLTTHVRIPLDERRNDLVHEICHTSIHGQPIPDVTLLPGLYRTFLYCLY